MKHVVMTDIVGSEVFRRAILDEMVKRSAVGSRSDVFLHSCRYADGEFAHDAGKEILIRYDDTYEWKWRDDELSQMARALINPFVHYYQTLTRVQCVVQFPGQELARHIDHAAGQIYHYGINKTSHVDSPETILALLREKKLRADPYLHQKQHFLGGRIFLSNDNRSYYEDGEQRVYYQPNNQFFFLCENTWHGSEAVDWWRGFLYIDGIYDPDAIQDIYRDHLA